MKTIRLIFLIVISCSNLMLAQEEDMTWENISGVEIYNNHITKAGKDGWDNASCSSRNLLMQGDYGYIKFKVTDLTTIKAIAFESAFSGPDYLLFDLCFLIDGDKLFIFEFGKLIGQFGKVRINDYLTIEKAPTLIKYKKNGITLYSRSSSDENSLVAALSLYNDGTNINNLTCNFSSSPFSEHEITNQSKDELGSIVISSIQGGSPFSIEPEEGQSIPTFETVNESLVASNLKSSDFSCRLFNSEGELEKMRILVGADIDWLVIDSLIVDTVKIPTIRFSHVNYYFGNGINLYKSCESRWENLISKNYLESDKLHSVHFTVPQEGFMGSVGLKLDTRTAQPDYSDISYGFVFIDQMCRLTHGDSHTDIGYEPGDNFSIGFDHDANSSYSVKYYKNNEMIYSMLLSGDWKKLYQLKIGLYTANSSFSNVLLISHPPRPILTSGIVKPTSRNPNGGSITTGVKYPAYYRFDNISYYNSIMQFVQNGDKLKNVTEGTYYVKVDYTNSLGVSDSYTQDVRVENNDAINNICTNDENRNWVETITYADENETELSHSVVYYDNLGRQTQTQSRIESENKILATQTIYDAFGRAVLSTLPAPTNSTNFCYQDNFVTSEASGNPVYSYNDFDKPNSTTTTNTGEIDNPIPVQNSIPGTLGYYYSNNNNLEPYVPATSFPYMRVEYDENNPGSVKRSSATGDVLRIGGGHSGYGFTMPTAGELFYLFGMGYGVDLNQISISGTINTDYRPDFKVFKTISRDENGHESVVFNDLDGKIIAKALSGQVNGANVKSLFVKSTFNEYKKYIDVHIPDGCDGASGTLSFYNSAGSSFPVTYNILNLITNSYLSNGNGTDWTDANDLSTITPGFYRFIYKSGGGGASYNCEIKYTLNYYDYTLYYYDKAGNLKAIVPPTGIASDYIPKTSNSVQSSYTNIEDFSEYPGWVTTPATRDPVVNTYVTMSNIPLATATDIRVSELQILLSKKETTVPPNETLNERTANISHPTSGDIFSFYNYSDPGLKFGSPHTNPGGNSGPQNSPGCPTCPPDPDDCNNYHYGFDFVFSLQAYNSNGVAIPSSLDIGLGFTGAHLDLDVAPTTPVATWTFYNYGGAMDNFILYPIECRNIAEIKLKVESIYMQDNVSVEAWTNQEPDLNGDFNCTPDPDYHYITPIVAAYLSQLRVNMILKSVTLNQPPAHTQISTFDYNSLGWKISDYTPDAGKTDYVYRKSGAMRFWQNEKQRTNDYFSYNMFDDAERVIESGEYHPGTEISFQSYEDFETSSAVSNSIHNLAGGNFVNYSWGGGVMLLSNSFERSNVYYDKPEQYIPDADGHSYHQEFMLGRPSVIFGKNATRWYSYDHEGKITWTLQKLEDIDPYTSNNQSLVKTMHYDYDFTGNVTEVAYEKYNTDESFFHHYTYDLDKRLIAVNTSRNGVALSKLATYSYYQHGPLKRMELGNRLQGIDFVYTSNGWLKSINSPDLDKTRDPGSDGVWRQNSTPDDLFGMGLDYFDQDYVRNNTNVQTSNVNTAGTSVNLYNGLIKSQRWRTAVNPGWVSPGLQHSGNEVMYAYNYDKQYQLKTATFGDVTSHGDLNNLNGTGNTAPAWSAGNDYKVFDLDYDPNGNIQHLNRNAYGTNISMDRLAYNYDTALPNRLKSVDESQNSAFFPGFEVNYNNSPPDYIYDELGQLTSDPAQSLYYVYNASGLVTEVYKDASKIQPLIKISYDESSQRLCKTTYITSGTDAWHPDYYTWYVRDMSGKIISVYEQHVSYPGEILGSLIHTEVPMYAAGRVGVFYPQTGKRVFEITDHLGNVRTTFTPKLVKNIVSNFDGHGQYDYLLKNYNTYDVAENHSGVYSASVKTHWPGTQYGMGVFDIIVHPGDIIDATYYSKYINYTGDNAAPDGMLVIQLNDEAGNMIPDHWYAAHLTPGTGWQNKTDVYTVDPTLTGDSYKLHVYFWNNEYEAPCDVWFDDLYISINGNTYSGIEAPDQQSLADYYPHGSIMPGRNYAGADNYRYGYQGQFAEKDKETKFNAFEARMFDALIARWASTDPCSQFFSPYTSMANNPVNSIDPDGRLVIFVNGYHFVDFGGSLYRTNSAEAKGYWEGLDRSILSSFPDQDEGVMYFDGSEGIHGNASRRQMYGHLYTSWDINSGVYKLKPGETIKIIAHSQGVAYAMGMASALIEKGYTVEILYALAAKGGDHIKPVPGLEILQFHVPGDPIAAMHKIAGSKFYQMGNDRTKKLTMKEGILGRHSIGNYYWIFGSSGWRLPKHRVPVEF